jgi:cytidylate kinase
MMKGQTREERKILAAAERQMQAWALGQEIAERASRADRPHGRPDQLGDFITISREAGACGGQVAELVGQKLGWEVLDKNLVDHVADRYRLSRPMLEMVDETTADWADTIFGNWFDRKIISHAKYVAHLSQVVLAAARRGSVVLVGRGAQFLLPRDQGLAVRIIAPTGFRVREIVRRHGLDAAEAQRFIARVDRDRRQFVQQFFHRDIDDPHLYDLVINVARRGPAATAEQIVDAYCP